MKGPTEIIAVDTAAYSAGVCGFRCGIHVMLGTCTVCNNTVSPWLSKPLCSGARCALVLERSSDKCTCTVIQITEITIKQYITPLQPLVHCTSVITDDQQYYECFITSRQHQETMSCSWVWIKIIHVGWSRMYCNCFYRLRLPTRAYM